MPEMQKALIHRYDNKPDILAVEKMGCSEVYRRSKDDARPGRTLPRRQGA